MEPILLAAPPAREKEAASDRDSLPAGIRPVNIAFENGRIFIPLAESGCGVGCKYCYIAQPAAAAQALPPGRVQELLRSAQILIRSQPAALDLPLLAIGCDTDPSLPGPVMANAVTCLNFARENNLPIQLATKFPLPAAIREILESWPPAGPHPIVFTTITTVALSSRVEPGAPEPAVRAANFAAHSSVWLSYALIKPFLASSADDRQALARLLGENRPDGAVIGIRYRRARPTDGSIFVHPFARDWIASAPTPVAQDFADQLTSMGLRVFMNTRCVSAWHNSTGEGQLVKRNYPQLCVQCGACG